MEYEDQSAQNTQRLKDFGLVAALISCDFTLINTEVVSKTVYFVFNNGPQLERSIKDYWANKLFVPARQYFDNTKMLKSLIYSEFNHGV